MTNSFVSKLVINRLALLVFLFIAAPVVELISNLGQLLKINVSQELIKSIHLLDILVGSSYRDWSFLLAGFVIFVNRDRLNHLNIDRDFLIFFFIVGLIYSRYNFFSTGWLVALMLVFTVVYHLKNKATVGEVNLVSRRTVLLIVLVFCVAMAIIGHSLNMEKIKWVIQTVIILSPSVVVEEFYFRGLLWGVLKDLKWRDYSILIVQTVLFWFFHIDAMFSDFVFFWVLVPSVSVILGIIVWRSKSIAPSTIAHSLLNVFHTLVFWAYVA